MSDLSKAALQEDGRNDCGDNPKNWEDITQYPVMPGSHCAYRWIGVGTSPAGWNIIVSDTPPWELEYNGNRIARHPDTGLPRDVVDVK